MEKLSNIPEFYVTNRDFEEVLWMSGLSKNDILNLPEKSNVLEVGGGVDQNFSAGIKSLRPDIQAITIDPTLIIGSNLSNEYDIYFGRNSENRNKFSYVQYLRKLKWYELRKLKPEKKSQKVVETKIFNQQRIQKAHEAGESIVSLAPEIPLKENSLNLLIDVYGPGIYLQTGNNSKLFTYFEEIYRVLKPGGEARVFPAVDIRSEINLLPNQIDEIRDAEIEINLENTKDFYLNIFKEKNLDFQVDFIKIKDPNSSEQALILVLRKN
jgi:hypothetical protein